MVYYYQLYSKIVLNFKIECYVCSIMLGLLETKLKGEK